MRVTFVTHCNHMSKGSFHLTGKKQMWFLFLRKGTITNLIIIVIHNNTTTDSQKSPTSTCYIIFIGVYKNFTYCESSFSFFSHIIHIPSKKTILVWSIDTSVPLFGIKFCCLLLFALFFSWICHYSISFISFLEHYHT